MRSAGTEAATARSSLRGAHRAPPFIAAKFPASTKPAVCAHESAKLHPPGMLILPTEFGLRAVS